MHSLFSDFSDCEMLCALLLCAYQRMKPGTKQSDQSRLCATLILPSIHESSFQSLTGIWLLLESTPSDTSRCVRYLYLPPPPWVLYIMHYITSVFMQLCKGIKSEVIDGRAGKY